MLKIAAGRLGVLDTRFLQINPSMPVAGQLSTVFGADVEQAVLLLIRACAVSFSAELFRRLPVLRPYAIRDGRKRKGAGGTELWGVPDDLGYFSDDNSLLKALPKGLSIVSDDVEVGGRRVTTGWTCCHGWRALPSGAPASKLGLLNSFVPGLTWLPTDVAHFTDREGSQAQRLLKDLAPSFSFEGVAPPLIPYIDRAWEHLMPATTGSTPVVPRHTFAFSESFVARRLHGLRSVVALLEDPQGLQGSKVLNSRYRAGLLGLDDSRRRDLASALAAYERAVVAAGSGRSVEVGHQRSLPEPG